MTRKFSVVASLGILILVWSVTVLKTQAQEVVESVYLPFISQNESGHTSQSTLKSAQAMPTPGPTPQMPEIQASTSATASDAYIVSSAASGETIQVPFTNGAVGVQTGQSYSGLVDVTVSGVGQAAGPQYSDAFYI